ncbi:MAG: hypothetical protein ACJ75H_01940 [Thermoanaerobaculia bacterium]
MSCPDWNALAAARSRGEEPAEWAAAAEHFDGCNACRREALRAEPLLVFRRMPGAGMSEAEERSEVESMQAAVAAMRAAERVAPREASRQRYASWRRWAAAAVLAFASLSVSWDKAPYAPRAAVKPAERPPLEAAVEPSGAEFPEIDLSRPAPVLEVLDRPARVYHLSVEGFSMMMVVDESIHV